jgi:hypothetical protein
MMELWNDDVLIFSVWVSSPTHRRHCDKLQFALPGMIAGRHRQVCVLDFSFLPLL